MSNRGRPSSGCQRCRSRKVKCDESKPTCLRCGKAGQACVYRDRFDIFVRDQTQEAGERAQRKWRTRAKTTASTEGYQSRRLSMEETSEGPNSLSLSSINSPIIDMAITRFFYDYVMIVDPARPHPGYLDFLPGAYLEAEEGSLLKASLSAVALANFNGRIRSSKAVMPGRQEYAVALRMTKDALEDSISAQRDETLLSIYLLGMYEIIQFPKHNRGSWSVHIDGAVALINMREGLQPSSEPSYICNRLMRLIVWQVLVKCLRNGLPAPPSISRWMGESSDVPSPISDFVSIQRQCTDLAFHILSSSPLSGPLLSTDTSEPEYHNLTSSYINFQASVSSYVKNLTRTHPYTIQTVTAANIPSHLSEALNHRGMPTETHTYLHIGVFHVWNSLRAARLRVELTRFQTGSTFSSTSTSSSRARSPSASRSTALKTIAKLCTEIGASVLAGLTCDIEGKPRAERLQDVCGIRAYFLLFPLNTAVQCLRTILIPSAIEESGTRRSTPSTGVVAHSEDRNDLAVFSELSMNGKEPDLQGNEENSEAEIREGGEDLVQAFEDQLDWMQIVLSHFQNDLAVSGAIEFGFCNATCRF